MIASPQNNFTRLSKTLSTILVVMYILQCFAPSTREYLALVAGRTFPCIWNLLTAGFVNINAFEVVVAVVALLIISQLVEPVYGSKEFLKFLLLVPLMTGLLTFITIYIGFAATQSGMLLYTQFCGFHGTLGALLVAIKQIMPEHALTSSVSFPMRAKSLVTIYVLLSTATFMVFHRVGNLLFLYYGTYVGWWYLRFLQPHPDIDAHGDPSEEFRFASFFPQLLQPAIDTVAKMCGVLLRLILNVAPREEGKLLLTVNGGTALGTDSSEASRRRERGSRALEERLGQKHKVVNMVVDVEACRKDVGSPNVGGTAGVALLQ